MESEDEALFARGIALFNDGEYFACHEVWEDLWKRSAGDQRTGLQGLIQAAAALLHGQRGNHRGARSVYRKAMRNLDAAGNGLIGTGLGDFRRSLDEYFAAIDQGVTPPSPPHLPAQAISSILKGWQGR